MWHYCVLSPPPPSMRYPYLCEPAAPLLIPAVFLPDMQGGKPVTSGLSQGHHVGTEGMLLSEFCQCYLLSTHISIPSMQCWFRICSSTSLYGRMCCKTSKDRDACHPPQEISLLLNADFMSLYCSKIKEVQEAKERILRLALVHPNIHFKTHDPARYKLSCFSDSKRDSHQDHRLTISFARAGRLVQWNIQQLSPSRTESCSCTALKFSPA